MDRMKRLELEFAAIDATRDKMRYLGYTPKHDTWRTHCAAFSRALADHLHTFTLLAEADETARAGC